MNSSQKHKVVLITGASSGIGEACAYAFSKVGCTVVLIARNAEKLQAVKAECEKQGAQALIILCDVSNEQSCKSMIDQVIARYGTIHILINNAGISMRALFAEAELSVIKHVMDINFWGTVFCTKYALPYLLQNKGSVISISSVAGIKGLPGRTGYSASKFAMNGFMEALRIENLHTGLHVGVMSPGYTASNIRNTALNKEGRAQSETPLDEQKLMQPEQVANEILQMVIHRKAEKVLTAQGVLTKWLNKFFPRLVDKLVFNVIKKEKDSPFK